MFGALAPDIALDDALMLADEIAAAPRPAPGAESLGSPAAFTGEKPWKQAYGLAGRLIERHPSWFASPPIDIEAFLADLDIRIVERELPTSGVQAVSFGGPQHAPTIVLNTNSPLNQSLTSRRFILAHELFHLLHDQDRGGTVAVASGPWTSPRVEQRANAFAAMLLMPEHLMFREMIGVDRTKLSSLETLASRFETGIIATISHAKNLGWLTWGQRQYLLQALDR
jgi:Zn-dependent peptidase ImmA (M78 family)